MNLGGSQLSLHHPKKNKQKPFIEEMVYQGSQKWSLVFGRELKAGRRVESFPVEKKEGFRFALIRGY